MSCESCSSANQAEFTVEMMIHSARGFAEDPGVLAFPKVLVCLNCGFSRFDIPEAELGRLREAHARSAAA